ncbi:hypothetical protein [Sulfurimonas sp. HSL-1716]|uniref:hypothetical protein n=1 Tax=Hydrocurvibacter sulfurireducens TaxID=3131937 RepID=UPI0031F887A3
MNNSFALDAYRSHDLNIMMRTSSGDVIKMDFSNEQNLSMNHKEGQNGTKDSLSFSSMQSFQFSIQGNGLNEQDKKEIQNLMKIAQPYIDKYMKELDSGEQKSPISKIAKQISDIFLPVSTKDQDTKNYAKNGIVDMFDKAAKSVKDINKVFDEAQKLLKKTLSDFDKTVKALYA